MTEQLFRKEALDAINDSGNSEFRLNPPTFVSQISVFTIILIVVSTWALGNTTYARKHIVFGNFDEHHVAQLANKRLGQLTQLSVQEGDVVQRDQLLGSIRQTPKNSHKNLLAETSSQIASLQKIAAEESEHFDQTSAYLSKLRQRKNGQLKLAIADIQLQTKKVEKLNKQIEQTSILFDKGYLSNLDWLQFQTSLITEQQKLNQQKQHAIQLRQQLDEIDSNQKSKQHTHNKRQSEIDIQIAQLNAAMLEQSDRNQQRLYAPQDGIITRIAFSPGETVFPGDIVLAVSESLPSISASLIIPSAAAGFINIGQELELEVDAFPATRHGRIKATVINVSDHIVKNHNQALGYEARLDIDPKVLTRQDHGRYLPGMNFKTFIRTEQKTLFRWLLAPLLQVTDLF